MNKYIFALTGGSGAGKSTVSEEFRRLGVYVSDADKAAREVVKKDSECLKELTDNFGKEILKSDGTLDRPALASIVFSDKKKLNKLNAITHKYIYQYIKEEIDSVSNMICAVDGAVIIGSPVMKLCNCVVSVTADRDIRIERIMRRDGLSRELAEKRIDAQKNENFYKRHSDYIIVNNAESDSDACRLGEQIEYIYNKIKDAAETAAAQKNT